MPHCVQGEDRVLSGHRLARPRIRGAGRAALVAFAGVLVIAVAAPTRAAPDGGVPDSGTAAASGAPSAPTADAGKSASLVPPATDALERMCGLLTACPGLPIPSQMIPSDFASCVRTLGDELSKPSAIGFSLTIRECGLQASTCAELRSCALRGAAPDACAGRAAERVAGYCDGAGRALSCFHDRVLAVRDCPRGGEQCAVRAGDAYCALGPCPPEMRDGAPPICSASGTRILRCEKGMLVSLDCTAFGLKCAVDDGGPGCAADTRACSASAMHCEGNVAVGCHHGHEVRVDCAAAGLVCATSAGPRAVGACAAPATSDGDACDPAAPARCDGAAIAYCAAGRPRTFSCKSVGMSRCASDHKVVHCAG